MPCRSKRARAAKKMHQNAHTAFSKPAPHTASPEDSEYLGSDDSVIGLESDNELGIPGGNGVKSSVEDLQQLYLVFLPPHLCLEEKGQEKHQRMVNRKAVYSGDLRMTIWRKKKALKDAAEGCKTLDAFVVRKVRLMSIKQWQIGGTHSS